LNWKETTGIPGALFQYVQYILALVFVTDTCQKQAHTERGVAGLQPYRPSNQNWNNTDFVYTCFTWSTLHCSQPLIFT